MGGDGGPAVTVPAAAALAHRADVVLVGDAEQIRAALPRGGAVHHVQHATQAVGGADSLAEVLRRKPDSSLRQALLRHAAGDVDAVVSGGDTAALLALSRAVLDMVDGIERPAICKDLEGMHGPFWMLDLGANIDCSARQLHDFARIGATLARHVGGIATPRVALLNIGTEAGKGPDVLAEAAGILRADQRLDYVGFVEGGDLFSGFADVVVADGFAGNVALKSIEGAARMARHLLRRGFDAVPPWQRLALEPLRGRLRELRHQLNPQRYNGASFVGLRGVVVKSHGSADAEGFKSAMEEALLEVEGRVPQRLAELLASD